ncbi:hypothetical protein FA740_19550, partial [Paracoccus hibiscisoli]
MPARIAHVSLLVPDYDTALDFFRRIGFECREDTDLGGGKRWVRMALLQKGGLMRDCPFPLHCQATRTISAVPRALKRFMSATRIWI